MVRLEGQTKYVCTNGCKMYYTVPSPASSDLARDVAIILNFSGEAPTVQCGMCQKKMHIET